MGREEILKRVLTALFAIPIFIYLVLYAHPAYLLIFNVIIVTFASWEYFTIIKGEPFLKILGTGLCAVPPIGAYISGHMIFLWLIPFILVAILFYFLFYHTDIHLAADLFGKTLLGVIYLGYFTSYIIGIKMLDYGGFWIVFLFTIIWSNDTFAFFIGKYFGRTKLAPKISPNKTVEGAIAGLIGGIFAGVMFNLFALKKLDLSNAVLLAVVFGTLSQMSDLFESMLKRSAGVKDSGSIIPGHGGVLDRIDSAIIPLPFFYYYLVWSL